MEGKPKRVFVVGVGMTKFCKPGTLDGDYPQWAKEAGEKALADAGIRYDQVEQAAVSYVYGETTCGQRCVYELGMTGIPVYNVNNACSSGSTALMMARQFIQGGLANCVMALGFEKMELGSLGTKYMDRTQPLDKHLMRMGDTHGITDGPITAQMFGNAAREHMEKYGSNPDHYAKVAYKNHKHSANNPYAQFRKVYSLEEIKSSRMIHSPLTKLQCSPTSDGAAAAILASEEFVKRHGLEKQAVEIIAQQMVTDLPNSFSNAANLVGYEMSKLAAERVYAQSGYRPEDIQVIELHDCFSANELVTYEALDLCKPGEGHRLVDRGDNTYGGKYVINPSGGLESKGHPLGATGLAQCAELSWQLRGMADKRQVNGARLALQHNIGLGGAAVVTMYQLGFPETRGSSPKSSASSAFKCEAVFTQIADVLKQRGRSLVQQIGGSYLFNVTNSTGEQTSWLVNCKEGSGSVTRDSNTKADCTLTMSDEDLYQVMTGGLDPQKAFMKGKLKLTGNMGLALKLSALKLTPSKL